MIETKDYFETKAEDWISGAYTQNDKENSIGYIRARLTNDAIKKYKPSKNLTICDLGCGNGHFARMLAAQGHTVYGIDQSEKMLEIARRNNGFDGAIKYYQSDIAKALSLELPNFDVITSLGVMYYFDTDDNIFSFVQEKIKPEGIYITSCRNKIFNLFPGSSANQAVLNDPQLIELLRETFMLANTIDTSSLMNFLEYCRKIELPELLKGETKENKPHHDEKTNEFVGRQHSPQELCRTAKKFGFIVEKTWGFQPHLFSTKCVDEQASQIQKLLSEGLMAFCELPIALMWSSHFLSLLRVA